MADKNTKSVRNIDFLRDSKDTGTPQVVVVPDGSDDREYVNIPKDFKIIPLSPIISHHFKDYWKQSIKDIAKKNAQMMRLVYPFIFLYKT